MATLGYWKTRGVGNPIRFLLEYVGEKYEEKLYTGDKAEEWFNEKYSLGLQFPNLPYYFDGDLKLTGSLSIMRHIARKHKLGVSLSEEQQCDLEMVEAHVYDLFWSGLVGLCYGKGDYESLKIEYVGKYMPDKLKVLSDYLGSKKFILGEQITYIDFYMYEVLYDHFLFAPEVFDKFQNLKNYLKTIEDLPAISSYMKTDRYIHSPSLSEEAKWRG